MVPSPFSVRHQRGSRRSSKNPPPPVPAPLCRRSTCSSRYQERVQVADAPSGQDMMQPPIQKTSFKTVQSPRVKYISPKEVALLISGEKVSDRKTISRTAYQKPSEQKTVDKSQWNSFNDVRCSQAHTPDKEQRILYDETAMNNLTGGSGHVSGNDYGNTGIQEENFTNCLASETCWRGAFEVFDIASQISEGIQPFMEIDMIGGTEVGRVDKRIPRLQARTSSAKPTPGETDYVKGSFVKFPQKVGCSDPGFSRPPSFRHGITSQKNAPTGHFASTSTSGGNDKNVSEACALQSRGHQEVYATDKSAKHGSSNPCMPSPKVETWTSPAYRPCSTNGDMHLWSSCSKCKRNLLEGIEERVEEIQKELDAIYEDRVGF